ncbi:hypothetical protein SLEP1_g21363 [Rubroshorea leprosula]|uniref:Uncharacterized protein n=1 Tax=Rubroshorea leprosula TaxID=152421 RepID=A0AAV5JGB7_9ROSI|nr:hypothetical protein SLEP1_g21363 [Rubroshorea leprosula]
MARRNVFLIFSITLVRVPCLKGARANLQERLTILAPVKLFAHKKL